MAGIFSASYLDAATDPTYDTLAPPEEASGPTPEPKVRYGKPLPPSWVPLYQKPMATPTRKLRIVTIGAAVSGLGMAYQLQHVHRLTEDGTAEHTIYEANADLGGTWLVNTYPGVACDVPAHVYTFPFEGLEKADASGQPNPDWTAYYATGEEILAYLKRTVAKYDLARDVKTNHRVERAEFDEDEGRWHLTVRNGAGHAFSDVCDVLVSATGFLSNWHWPSIPGLHDFKGHLLHSAAWDPSWDLEGKKIAIIGNGSSAIQIVPELAPIASSVVNFIRHPTFITPGLGSGIIDGAANYTYSDEEKRAFREDPGELKRYRKRIQHATNASFGVFTKGSQAQADARAATVQMMRDRLGGDEELAARMIPDWEVGCRRATPGPGYLESFTRDNVQLVTDGIERVTDGGIVTADGEEREFDVVVCATGFDVSHRPPWPLVGRRGRTLAEHWAEEPLSYLSLMTDGFPNFFMFGGPNSPVGHGSLMSQLGWSADWMCRWVRKMAEEDIKFIDPKPDVVEEFNAYADEIHQTLVWSGGCRSWYKNHRVDGKVTAVWAGSAIGYYDMLRQLRGEDFEIRYRSKNRFRFMGNGKTTMEYQPGEDLGFYIYK